jgi:lipopolysaccharide transport system ATP-binding protein
MSSNGQASNPLAADNNELLISARSVGKSYHIYVKPQDRLKQALWRGRRQYYREFWALRDVSFDVHRGEAVGIIGRNGCGKSTLLQIIAGTLTPTEGEVRVSGRVAALLELGSGFNPDFTGRENVYMNGAILGVSRSEMEKRFDDIAAFADIGEFLDQPVKTYSSGMFARLAFGVAINVDPDILIVDEILAVGDAIFQAKCFRRIDRLRQQGTPYRSFASARHDNPAGHARHVDGFVDVRSGIAARARANSDVGSGQAGCGGILPSCAADRDADGTRKWRDLGNAGRN